MTLAAIVYILCALTSLACALLLLRGWRRSGARLLLWSGLCFVGFTLNNAVLFIDLIVLPDTINLAFIRNLLGLLSVAVLLYGLIWEVE
ncbi:MAG: hypothetical protein H0W72_07305 [Planctomycetes bacterium]|nr:hypothetical protein [Planctomycetota bacterium]